MLMKLAGRVQDVRQDVPRQAFGGQQMNQLTVFIELGVALIQHAPEASA